jgi:hypothetical protein
MLIDDVSSTSDWHWLGWGIVRFAKYLMKLEVVTHCSDHFAEPSERQA